MTIKLKVDKQLVDRVCKAVLSWEQGNFDKCDLESFMEFLASKMDRAETNGESSGMMHKSSYEEIDLEEIQLSDLTEILRQLLIKLEMVVVRDKYGVCRYLHVAKKSDFYGEAEK